MKETAFLISNGPEDKELLKDFLECALDVTIKSLEFSSVSPGTALIVVLTEEIDLQLQDIAQRIKKEEEKNQCDKPLLVEDPGYSMKEAVVTNLDQDFLCPEFLKLYIASAFNDGHNVICNCELIPDYERAAVLTFDNLKVLSSVLMNECHTPLQSVRDYQIHFKPYYSKFYSKHTQKNWNQNEKEQSNLSSHNISFHADSEESADSFHFYPIKTDEQEETAPESLEVENDTIKMCKAKWELIKEEVREISECLTTDYVEKDQILHISGKDVANSKHEITHLLRNVKIGTLLLTDAMQEVLSWKKMKDELAKNHAFNEKITFDVSKNTLTLYALQDVKQLLETFQERYLYSESIPIPEDLPSFELEELKEYVAKSFIAVVSWDDKNCTLTGQKEDVVLALRDVKKMFKKYTWVSKTFTITGNKATYATRFAERYVRDLLEEKDAQMSRPVCKENEVTYEYKCIETKSAEVWRSLKKFSNEIKEEEVNLKDFKGEDVSLIGSNLKRDSTFLQKFQTKNSCVVVVKRIGNNEFFRLASKSKLREQGSDKKKRPSRNKDMKVYSIGNSCNLQLSSRREIVKEKSDLLVCGVDHSLNLDKTAVSTAFSNADPNLKTDISTFKFSPNGVVISQRSLPGTNCKAIAFITMKVWQQGVSDKQLTAALEEVLNYANNNGLKSVSFPPLGIGRRFKFPVDATAQAFITAFENFKKANSYLKVNLIDVIAGVHFPVLCSKADNSDFKSIDGANSDSDEDGSGTHEDEGSDSPDAGASGGDEEYKMEAFGEENLPQVSIVSRTEVVVTQFLEAMKKKWLHKDQFNPVDFCWPPSFMNEFTQKAKSLDVWLCKSEDPATKQYFCEFKGKKEEVIKLKDEMKKKYDEIIKSRKELFAPSAPHRGTLEFIQHAAGCDGQFPTYWKHQDLESSSVSFQGGSYIMHDVNEKTKKAITDLVSKTWDVKKVGRGNDATGIPLNSNIQVENVQRVENADMFLRYFGIRRSILRDMAIRKRVCDKAAKLQGSAGGIMTMDYPSQSMKKELLHEVNECYLLHGTKEDIVKSICQVGLDNRLSRHTAMFGQGVYMAESSTKADQYSDDRNKRLPNGHPLHMFLTRVTLGDIFLCNKSHPSVQTKDSPKLKRPPCRSCGNDICGCNPVILNHSVMGDDTWLFREFVVYNNNQCYPEYLITYKRV